VTTCISSSWNANWIEPVEIRTPRLILRTARPDDLEAMHAVLSDPRATLWWSTPPHETVDQTAEWLEGMIDKGPDNPDFVIERDGRVIGKAGFYVLPDVGYILHPDHWGHGLASEAVSAVIDHVFATRDLEAVTADVDPDNAASIRLLERLGFVNTGFAERTWHIGGEWKDSLYYGLSLADWRGDDGVHTPA
jgi:ribosomal-protein-alanine N-acetyltransferase